MTSLTKQPDPRRCLTLHQPWASLVVHGIKRAEGRIWELCRGKKILPGRLWIHSAAKKMSLEDKESIESMYKELFALDGVVPVFPKNYPRSSLLGCIDLVKVVSQDDFQSLDLRDSVKGESSSPFVFLCTRPRKLILPLSCLPGDHKIWLLSKDILGKAEDQGLKDVSWYDANFEEALKRGISSSLSPPPPPPPPPTITSTSTTTTSAITNSSSNPSTGKEERKMQKYDKKSSSSSMNTIYFYGHAKSKKYGCFSQFYQPAHFVDDSDVHYNCAEQWMMASKARVFNDHKTLQQILNETDPHRIKRLGRLVENFDNAIWDGIKYEIVLTGNRFKFQQNKNLMYLLKSTGKATLVEAAANDRIWGIGISVEDATRGRKWKDSFRLYKGK